jgi:hypothetical protein
VDLTKANQDKWDAKNKKAFTFLQACLSEKDDTIPKAREMAQYKKNVSEGWKKLTKSFVVSNIFQRLVLITDLFQLEYNTSRSLDYYVGQCQTIFQNEQ